MCATINAFYDREKSYLLIDKIYYGFKRFLIINDKICAYHRDKNYNFDSDGFTILDNNEQEIRYPIAYQEIDNLGKVNYNVLYKKFNKELGYHISPISTDFDKYKLSSTCLVQFNFDDIQFSDGNDIVVNKFKILDDNYDKIYDILVKVFNEKEIVN